MLRSARNLLGHRMSAKDGDIGRCVDLLVDHGSWSLRYLVVEAGPWLSGRRLIMSPFGLSKAEWTTRRMAVDTSRVQVETAPILEEDGLLTRDHEIDLFRHYGWSSSSLAPLSDAAPRSDLSRPPPLGPSLRSLEEILSYGLEAEGAPAGHVHDFIVDDDTWRVPYFVVESQSWLTGRKILVPTEQILGVNWDNRAVEVGVPVAAIEEAPEYDPTNPVYDTRVLRALSSPTTEAERAPVVPAWLSEWVASDMWGTRGLRAALARIIHG